MIGMMKPILFSASLIALQLQLTMISSRVIPNSGVYNIVTHFNNTSHTESLEDSISNILDVIHTFQGVEFETETVNAQFGKKLFIAKKLAKGDYHNTVIFKLLSSKLSLSSSIRINTKMILHVLCAGSFAIYNWI